MPVAYQIIRISMVHNKIYEFFLDSHISPTVNYLHMKTVDVSLGNRAYLPCQVSNQTNILWRKRDKIIVYNGSMNGNFSDRFSLGNARESYHDMIISESRPSDTGVYECIGDNGNGRLQHVVLSVSGKHLRQKAICKSY
jgi:hypothetical protein